MANVLNRTTLEYRPSVNTPEYPDPPWLANPDLSAVAGVPVKYWNLTGNIVSEMTPAQKAIVDANEASAATTADRAAEKAAADRRALIALVQVLVDEVNTLRQWAASLKTVTAASTNYATLKTGIGTLPATPDRTYAAARTAILNRIDSL